MDSYTREEIEVEYILDYFYAECKIQRTPDAHNILANSVLEFIWKIAGRSIDYTTLNFQNKLKKYAGANRYRTTTTTLDCLPSVKSEASCGGLLQGKESIQNTSKIHEFSYLLLVSIPINPIDPIYE